EQHGEGAPDGERAFGRTDVEDPAEDGEIHEEAGERDQRHETGEVERSLTPRGEFGPAERGDGREHHDDDLGWRAEIAPEAREEKQQGGADGDSAESRDDPESPGAGLLRGGGMDVVLV